MQKSPWTLLRFAALFAALLCLYLIANFSLQGSGFVKEPNLVEITAFAIIIILFNGSKKLFWCLLFPAILLHAFYTPVGLSVGAPNYAYIASVFASDLSESKEFLAQLSVKHIVIAISIIMLLILFRKISIKFDFQFYRNKTFVALGVICLLFSASPVRLFTATYTATQQVLTELKQLNQLQQESEWGKSELTHSQYDDYVLIIGESARRDYHHAYGYPVENTPFMSSSNGVLVDGLNSAGRNTISSLRLMLTLPFTEKWEPNYALTLVDLIKSAGLKTYWLSVQGQLGAYDTPISSIGKKSDETRFLRAGDSFSEDISDFSLLPEFQQVISQSQQGKRFIVLHLYGSHPGACERVKDYPLIYPQDQIPSRFEEVNCYISSIKKTDDFLRQVYEMLQQNQQKTDRTFSMLYFSDHGLVHQDEGNKIVINNSIDSVFMYDIPLFKVSSDDTERKVYKTMKSGLNFTNGIANWVGISNPKLNPNADLFNGKSDNNGYGLAAILRSIQNPPDPAVVIPLKQTEK